MHSMLYASAALLILSVWSEAAANERILDVYIFHRHGDRTAKAWAPVNLTSLGAEEVHSSGNFYQSRYISSSSHLQIAGMGSGVAVLSQLSVSSPDDAVLRNSATSLLQGLYPPTGSRETLANGLEIEAPLGGYQYIPVREISKSVTGSDAENNAWLQGNKYKLTLKDSKAFYQSLLPVINGTYGLSSANFKNGYGIFDMINVARIHNSSIPAHSLLTNETLSRFHDLASTHEWNLAYNATDFVRAIAGSVLAVQILNSLQGIVNAKPSSPKFIIQLGAYGSFMSFFGLAQLHKISNDFYGITDYASSMTFEVYTQVLIRNLNPLDIGVRFLHSNGTANTSSLTTFPLFGQSQETLSWNDFKMGMRKFAIADSRHWCQVCGNAAGQCASNSIGSGSNTAHKSKTNNNGISKLLVGVIGSQVTLTMVLGLETLLMLFGGLRIIRKSNLDTAKPQLCGNWEHQVYISQKERALIE